MARPTLLELRPPFPSQEISIFAVTVYDVAFDARQAIREKVVNSVSIRMTKSFFKWIKVVDYIQYFNKFQLFGEHLEGLMPFRFSSFWYLEIA